MNDDAFDLIVIGGGPGGYVAAIRAAQLGMRTALVEREHLGGVCSNWGCIPTKALLHTASLYRQMRQAEHLGLQLTGLSFDFQKIIAGSRTVAGQMNQGVRHLLRKNRVTLFEGSARLSGKGRLTVDAGAGAPVALSAPHLIVATGARPRALPGLAFDGRRIWNYRDALQAASLPKSLLIVGAGAIGVEFASFFAAFGTAVTLIEMQDRILPAEDREVSEFVKTALAQQQIDVRCATRLKEVTPHDDRLDGVLEHDGGPTRIQAERLLVAIGVVGNIDHLGLEHTAATIERDHIVADAWGRTAEPGLYAIGDVTGAPWLAHQASHAAVACVEQIAGLHDQSTPRQPAIPACTYCHPQVASVGLTEQQATEAGYRCRIGRFPFIGNGKARALGEPDGFIKTVFDAASGELLGAHLVGADVTELIHGFALAMQMEATEAEIMETVFPHPSLSEAMHESVLAAFGRALHI